MPPRRVFGASATAAVIACAAVASPRMLGAQTTVTTVTTPTVPLFTLNDLWLAGSFVGLTIAFRPVDEHWALLLQNPRSQENRFLHDVAIGFRTIADPGSFIIGTTLYVAGRVSNDEQLADLGLHGTEALIIGSGVAYILKGAFGRARPYVHPATDTTRFNPNSWQFGRGYTHEQYRSFPSGHTVAAFAAAAAVANETSRWWPHMTWVIGPAMYGGAALVGVSRMYDNKHWASDVMMGAAIGTFAGNKVVRYFHRTNPNSKLDKWLLNTSISHAPDGGLKLSWMVLPLPR